MDRRDEQMNSNPSRSNTSPVPDRADILTAQRPTSTDNSLSKWRLVRSIIDGLIVLLIVAMFALVVWTVLTADTSASVSSDQRLVELTQWTIGAILTVAIGLVGYNWLTTRHGAEREQQIIEKRFEIQSERLDDSLNEYSERLSQTQNEYGELIQDLNRRLADFDKRMEETGSHTAALRDHVEQLRIANIHARMTTLMLEILHGSKFSRHRRAMTIYLNMFLELKHHEMNEAIANFLHATLNRIASFHPEEPPLPEVTDSAVEQLAKSVWSLDQLEEWIEEHDPTLREAFDRFSAAYIGEPLLEQVKKFHPSSDRKSDVSETLREDT
jgi:uncharacterized membrane-anchored protein YhcB (DUF1043 family)